MQQPRPLALLDAVLVRCGLQVGIAETATRPSFHSFDGIYDEKRGRQDSEESRHCWVVLVRQGFGSETSRVRKQAAQHVMEHLTAVLNFLLTRRT